MLRHCLWTFDLIFAFSTNESPTQTIGKWPSWELQATLNEPFLIVTMQLTPMSFIFSILLQINYQSWKSFRVSKEMKSCVTTVICNGNVTTNIDVWQVISSVDHNHDGNAFEIEETIILENLRQGAIGKGGDTSQFLADYIDQMIECRRPAWERTDSIKRNIQRQLQARTHLQSDIRGESLGKRVKRETRDLQQRLRNLCIGFRCKMDARLWNRCCAVLVTTYYFISHTNNNLSLYLYLYLLI